MTDRCTISNLSDYISAIEKHDLYDCISRGEHRLFDHPLRSGIRRDNLENYSKLLEEYYLNVETSISPKQEQNFLAFSQHHGMSTNLLDFSFSPLVSLYFATLNCNSKGYVYFIKKSKLIRINKLLHNKPLGWGMFDELLSFNDELYQIIMPQMSEVFSANRQYIVSFFERHADRFIADFRSHRTKEFLERLEGGVNDFELALKKYRQYVPEWIKEQNTPVTLQIYDSYSLFIESMAKIYRGTIDYPDTFIDNYRKISSIAYELAPYAANIHILMFLLKMEEIEATSRLYINSEYKYEIEFPFYFIYNPPIIDDRVKNQSSVFVFQPFSTNRISINGAAAQEWQKIVPDFVIEIQNPDSIARELDSIGFNAKHIFSDYDHIAKYIMQSFPDRSTELAE